MTGNSTAAFYFEEGSKAGLNPEYSSEGWVKTTEAVKVSGLDKSYFKRSYGKLIDSNADCYSSGGRLIGGDGKEYTKVTVIANENSYDTLLKGK